MRKIGTLQAEVDATKIIEENDDFLVVPAVIAREGVFKHAEGTAYYPADELKKAAWTAEGAWVVAEKHPDTIIVTSADDIVGRVEKPFFCSQINGLRGNLRFDKKRAKPEFLADIKGGKRKDVSWGYFYDEDPTPGEWNGQHYDHTRRAFLVDHVAAGVPLGRCHSPYCGIAVDAVIHKPAADPWEETDDYIRSGHKEPGETCRTIDISEEKGIKAIVCKYGDKWEIQSYLFAKDKDWTKEKAKAWFEEHRKAADVEKLSLEQLKEKIIGLSKERAQLEAKAYPNVQEQPTEEQIALRAELAVLSSMIYGYQKAIETRISQAVDQIERCERLLAFHSHNVAELRRYDDARRTVQVNVAK